MPTEYSTLEKKHPAQEPPVGDTFEVDYFHQKRGNFTSGSNSCVGVYFSKMAY